MIVCFVASSDGNETTYIAFGYDSSKFQSTRDAIQHAKLQSPVEFLVNLYREQGNKRLFCDSIFDLKEQLVALQLVMAQLNKEVIFSKLYICKVTHKSMLSYGGNWKGAGVLVLAM